MSAKNARVCSECGGPLSSARAALGVESCSGPCNLARRVRLADATHGGNHALLPEGARLKSGFCADCDLERANPPASSSHGEGK